jgi:UDP-galactopyranose mutase
METPPSGHRRTLHSVIPAHDSLDVVCLSHLRWDFVFQRPQHLLTRCARTHRVFFVEEPIDTPGPARLDVHLRQQGVRVLVPRVSLSLDAKTTAATQARLLNESFKAQRIDDYLLWYYTPMALAFTRHLKPRAIVYDCMDELTAFAGAPAAMREHEQELLSVADVVFTGGQTLYEYKRHCHSNVHAFPSSVDVAHFASARESQDDPEDQARIPHPRLGFFGVIDERLDIDLLGAVAQLRPDWHLILIGPVAKIDPASLPLAANIHYLGAKKYEELPSYLAGWDVALLPFARNEATRFISPTKTPEYLAAGKPVVSTSIRDVVRPYGVKGLARIADTPDAFVAAIEAALAEDSSERLRDVDAFLTQMSWDGTWTRMYRLVTAALSTDAAGYSPDAASISQPGVA